MLCCRSTPSMGVRPASKRNSNAINRSLVKRSVLEKARAGESADDLAETERLEQADAFQELKRLSSKQSVNKPQKVRAFCAIPRCPCGLSAAFWPFPHDLSPDWEVVSPTINTRSGPGRSRHSFGFGGSASQQQICRAVLGTPCFASGKGACTRLRITGLRDPNKYILYRRLTIRSPYPPAPRPCTTKHQTSLPPPPPIPHPSPRTSSSARPPPLRTASPAPPRSTRS